MYKKRNQILSIFLCLFDSVLVLCSFTVAGLIRYDSFRMFFLIVDLLEAGVALLLVSVPVFYWIHDFDQMVALRPLETLYKVVLANACMFVAITVYSFCTKNSMALSRLTLMYLALVNTALQYAVHMVIRGLYRNGFLRANSSASHLLLFVSKAQAAQAIAVVRRAANWRSVLAGVVLTDMDAEGEDLSGVPVVATMETYLDYATSHVVDEALILQGGRIGDGEVLRELICNLEMMGIVVNLQIPMVDTGIRDTKRVYQFGDYYVVGFTTRLFDYRLLLVKRLMDILGGCVGLMLTALVSLVVAPLIVLESPGPVFFSQNRVGRNGRVFRLYKFRSMRKDAESLKASMMADNEMQGPLFKIRNDSRVTRVGRFLRKTSLDEMPQFWNVLRGDMSLVGTRPPTVDEYAQYTHQQKRRLSFRPGLTGLWQISGRNDISDFGEVVRMDLEYIDNWSIRLDGKILAKTMLVVFERKGAA